MVAEDNKEVKGKGDSKTVKDVDKELHDTGRTGWSRGKCGAINQGLIYVGMPLNPDPPKNESVTTVPGVRPIATTCQGCFHLRSHV